MGASKRLMEELSKVGRSVLKGNFRPTGTTTVDLVPCQRCGRSYIPNDYEVCDQCADELDHNMEMEEQHEQV